MIISGRGGFKQVTAERLRRVEVRYRSTVVRAWELGYETGPFGKSRLVSLTQFGLDNLPFPGNVHRFDYYDDVGTGSVLQGFGTGAAVSSIDGDPSAGVDIPSALDAVGVAEASVLGGSHSISMGTHFYAGFNPTQPTKQGSYGIKIGGNFSQTDGFVGFFDIDGDGLSDRVFQEGDRWYYNRSSLESDGSVTFADAAAIGDFPGLSRERAFTISVGPEAYPLAFQFHSNVALTLTQADTYLSDVNGDGFVDVVQGGNVYFNRPEGDRGFEFAFNDPSDTPIELRPSVVDGAPLRGDYSDLADAFEQAAPPIDIVRRFRAPYSGRVRITGPVGLRRAQPEGADGVRVSIEHEGTSLWTDDIVPTDTSERSPVLELDVVARDRIHFRVHSRSDGREDAVDWHPVIEYVDRPAGVVDENELPVHRFDALDDFTIAGRTGAGIKLPFTGVLRVTGTLRKLRQTTDDVVCRVAVNGTVVFERALAWDEVTDIVLDQDIAVAQEDFVTLFIDSDSPIDLSALTFEPPPTIEYLSAETVDESGETVPVEVIGPSGEPLFLHPLPYDIQTFSFQLPEAPPTPFVPSSDRTLVVTATAASMTAIAGGTVTFTAKSEGRLVAKRLIHVPAGDAASVTVDVPVRRGRPVFFAFSADDPSLFAALMTAATYALPGGGLAALPTIQYGPDVPTRLTRGYRGWSFVGYNGGDGRGDAPIDPDVLEAPPSFDGDDEASDDWSEAQEQARRFGEQEQLVFALYPVPSNPDCVYDRFETDRVEQDVGILCSDAAGAHLKGPDEFVYVAGTTMSASRLGPDQVDVPSSGRLAGGRAVPRITLSHQIATGLGLGPLSASFVVDGRGSSKLDFLDMNGDGFPDVVGGEATQYTDPTGTLRWTDSLPARPVRETGSQSITLGIGGNIASAQINGRGHAGTGPDGRAGSGSAASTQMATLGVGLSATAGAGVATTLYDLLDVNGDGLPDRVRQSDTGLRVSLNLGYEFAAEETWGAGFAHRSNSRELTGGASLSFGDGVYGFGGGVSATHSTTRVEPMDDLPSELLGAGRETLIDVNGDGLLDLVQPGDSALRVWFNRGHGFAPTAVEWQGALPADVNETASTSLSGGGYFTIGVGPLCVGACYLVLNPGADAGETVSRPTAQLRDVDGDGDPDHVVSTETGSLAYVPNRTDRTNLLREVVRPLGGKFWLGYQRAGNTRELPHNRWVLSEVKTFDGVDDSAELGAQTDYTAQRTEYEGGVWDRRERELLGFTTVTVEDLDTRGWNGGGGAGGSLGFEGLERYRMERRTYRTDGYHTQGLLAESRVLGGDGATLYQANAFTYELRDAETGAPLPETALARAGSVFPALVRTDRSEHEGDASVALETYTTQDYDAFGNVVRLFDAGDVGPEDDYTAVIAYTASDASCLGNHIVGVAKRIEVTDAAGARLRLREATVDCTTGRMTELREHLGRDAVAQTDLGYDSDGNLREVTGPPNHRGERYRLSFEYDPATATHVQEITDSFGYVSTAAHDLRLGLPTREEDINGNAVETHYDAFGRVRRIVGPHELGRAEYTLRYSYRPDAIVPFARTEHIDTFRSLDDPIETWSFVDGFGRVLQTKKDGTVHRGDDEAAQDVVIVAGRRLYDPWGRVVGQWHPTTEPKAAPTNRVFQRTVDSTPPTRFVYDQLDRVTATTLPDGATTSTTYGLGTGAGGAALRALTTVTDAEGGRRISARDVRGLIRAIVEVNGDRQPVTRYEYDPLSQIRRVTDAAGNVTTVGYDLAGRRTAIDNPDSGLTTFQYDAAGNLIRRVTPNLRARREAVEYRYDHTRLVAIDYPVFSDADVSYTWGDADLRGRGGNRVGRITRVTDASGVEERRYGPLGELVEQRRTVASRTLGRSEGSPEVYTTRWLYDTWGRLQQMVYPDGEVLTYRYDAGGQVRSAEGVKLGERFPYVARLEYDAFGQRVFQETGNGVRTHYEYDARTRRLAELDAGEFQRLRYGYDDVGNIRTLDNIVPRSVPNEYGGPSEQSFAYDGLYRLTSASGTFQGSDHEEHRYTLSVGYDDIHNITHKTQEHWVNRPGGPRVAQRRTSYDWAYEYGSARPHAPTHVGDRGFHYDPNGNQLGWTHDRSGQRRTIVWDEEDRIRSIADNGRTTEFVYDAEGTRVFKVGAQGETAYVNSFWTVRNRSVGTKHVFVGTTRIASKLSPGEAAVEGDADPWMVTLGKWYLHRSDEGRAHARDVDMNPHYRVPSTMPTGTLAETHFVYFYHPDHLGSTAFVTDPDGELYEHVAYFPSGEPWVDERSNTERLPYLFSGKELDQETGLYDFGARQYDPRVGVWLSADPALTQEHLEAINEGEGIYLPAHLSPYSYALSNPLGFVDPDGRNPIQQFLAFVYGLPGAVGAVAIGMLNRTLANPQVQRFVQSPAFTRIISVQRNPTVRNVLQGVQRYARQVRETTQQAVRSPATRQTASDARTQSAVQRVSDAASGAPRLLPVFTQTTRDAVLASTRLAKGATTRGASLLEKRVAEGVIRGVRPTQANAERIVADVLGSPLRTQATGRFGQLDVVGRSFG